MSQQVVNFIKGKYLKKRKRTKKLLQDIKEQIEFYFSDANLSRDKFLNKHVGKDGMGYVSLSLLLSFNRLKEMGATKLLIRKALSNSTLLTMSENLKKVSRTTKFRPPPTNIDHCTIYVDSLPANATVQWLKDVCSKVGPLRYISLPRCQSGSIKGFAFVEFVHVEDAILACSILNSPPKNFFPKLAIKHISKTSTSDSLSKATLAVNNVENDLYSRIDRHPTTNNVSCNISRDLCVNTETSKFSNHANKASKDLLPQTVHCEESEKSPIDNISSSISQNSVLNHELGYGNTMDCSVPNKPSVKSKITVVKPNKPRKRDSSVTLDVYSEDLLSSKIQKQSGPKIRSEVVAVKKTSKCKRKRKRKQRVGCSSGTKVKPLTLHAIPKLEWLDMKRSYLREQRENFGRLKSVLQKWPTTDSETTSGYIKRHIALNNKQLDNVGESKQTESSKSKMQTATTPSQSSAPTFLPGVIASLTSLTPKPSFSAGKELSPLPSYDKIKQYFSKYGGVAYVDVNPGSCHGYVRFSDTSSAQRAIMEEKKFGLVLLTGAEEENYWDALLQSRQQKRSGERRKLRGKEKLVSKAEYRIDVTSKRHIKFNDDF